MWKVQATFRKLLTLISANILLRNGCFSPHQLKYKFSFSFPVSWKMKVRTNCLFLLVATWLERAIAVLSNMIWHVKSPVPRTIGWECVERGATLHSLQQQYSVIWVNWSSSSQVRTTVAVDQAFSQTLQSSLPPRELVLLWMLYWPGPMPLTKRWITWSQLYPMACTTFWKIPSFIPSGQKQCTFGWRWAIVVLAKAHLLWQTGRCVHYLKLCWKWYFSDLTTQNSSWNQKGPQWLDLFEGLQTGSPYRERSVTDQCDSFRALPAPVVCGWQRKCVRRWCQFQAPGRKSKLFCFSMTVQVKTFLWNVEQLFTRDIFRQILGSVLLQTKRTKSS